MSTFYSQQDARWATVLLGYNTEQPWNIGRYGCVCTSWGNMLVAITGDEGYSPAMINQWMKDHQGFEPGGGIFRWWVALGMGHVSYVKESFDINEVNNWTKANPNYAIVCYNNGAHYCLSNMSGRIVDSADGRDKGIEAYKFTSAKLYTSLEPGKGAVTSATISVTTSGSSEPVMNASDKKLAYEVVLNREPEDPNADGRTAMQFIVDAQAEVAQRRALDASQVATAQSNADQANQKASGLQTQLTATQAIIAELQRQANMGSPRTSDLAESDFTTTYRPDARRRYSSSGGSQWDFSGENPDVAFATSTLFNQAGTFVKDGVVLVRTQRSVDAGTWYGADELYFDDEPTNRADTIPAVHATASMALGLVQRVEQDVANLFHKKKGK